MEPLPYYTAQSPFTDPGKHSAMFGGLPQDVGSLSKVVQGLIVHFRDGEKLFNYTPPVERLSEADTRYMEKMLMRIHEMDDRPLTEARPPEKRLVGSCRDFATLFVSMMRHHGVPSRVRFGFGAYFLPGFNQDHVIAEFWDSAVQQWRLVDPEMSDQHVAVYKIPFDTHNVPRDQFIVGGLAWNMCAAGESNPKQFGVEPESNIRGWLGWPAIQHKLVQDLAALNKVELLPWDVAGLMGREPNQEEMGLLSNVAVLTQAGNEAFPEVQDSYETEPVLKVPAVIESYSPAAGLKKVALMGLPT
jgi:hypothetical protein